MDMIVALLLIICVVFITYKVAGREKDKPTGTGTGGPAKPVDGKGGDKV